MATMIADSGAAAAIFPMEWSSAGSETFERKLPLQDAQGREIPTYGLRDLEIVLRTQEGSSAILQERIGESYLFCLRHAANSLLWQDDAAGLGN